MKTNKYDKIIEDELEYQKRVRKLNTWSYNLIHIGIAGTVMFGGSLILHWQGGDVGHYIILTIISLFINLIGLYLRKKEKNKENRPK